MNEDDETKDIVRTDSPANPFERRELAPHANIGAVSIESERAIAEAQGKLIIAKRFPRDEARAYSAVMAACSRPALAEVAMYAYPRGKQKVTGPSIRLAEELARCWGNMSYGLRELSRKEGVSEMEAFAWDEETNVRSLQQFTVRHIRDTTGGPVKLTDERDVYEITANNGARRLRARILAIIPPDIIEAAIAQCRKTVEKGSDEPISDRIRKMVVAFSKFGVTADQVEARLGHKVDETTLDDLSDLNAIRNSLRDGATKVADWFTFTGAPGQQSPPVRPRALAGVAGSAADEAPPPTADATPAPAHAAGEASGGTF